MPNNFYGAIALTGGTAGALDAIDGANLNDLDAAFVQILNKVYSYTLDDDSGVAESSPDVISPDTNAGTKRWILQGAEFGGFVTLGTGAPVIKMKKLTGTTGSTEGDITNLTHGLTVSKIIGCQVFITQSSNNLIPPEFTNVAEHEYGFFILASVVRVVLHATNSSSILNGAITVLLTYEE